MSYWLAISADDGLPLWRDAYLNETAVLPGFCGLPSVIRAFIRKHHD